MKQERSQFSLEYVISHRTGGANYTAIFESLPYLNQEALKWAIIKIPYVTFLKTSYWFAVSSVAKARAGMRCQVCNSGQVIQVHHRTYDNHGAEHLHMVDLVVLCDNCHGLFHGHKVIEYKPPRMRLGERVKPRSVPKVIPHSPEDVAIPDGETITLTGELLQKCKTVAGGLTNATIRALGVPIPLRKGWTFELLGKQLPREQYKAAVEGRFQFNSGRLRSAPPEERCDMI
jgi:hypothetical protein